MCVSAACPIPLFGGPHVIEETTHFLFSSLIISTKWIDRHQTGFHHMALRKRVNYMKRLILGVRTC